MRITLNGEPHDLAAPLPVLDLLTSLAVDPRTVAVELNRVVVKRARYADTLIAEGAEVEIVAFVGGGSEPSRGAAGATHRRAAARALVVLSLVSGATSGVFAGHSPDQTPATPAAAKPVPLQNPTEAAAIGRGWALLAQGDLPGAAAQAMAALESYPRNPGALALAVEVELPRAGSMAALATYERWLGDRHVENAFVLRRIAGAYLREVVASGSLEFLTEAQLALARDGDQEALSALLARARQGNLKDTEQLAALNVSDAVKNLVTQLRASPPLPQGLRMTIVDALRDSRNPQAVAPLVELLTDKSDDLRANAADALGRMGARTAVANLRPLLEDPRMAVKLAAATSLYRLDDFSGVNFLNERLYSTDPTMSPVKVHIAEAMANHPDGNWQALVRGLIQDVQPEVRLRAARLLAPYDPELVKITIDQLLNDPNLAIRELAGQKLASEIAGDFGTLRRLLRTGGGLTRIGAADRMLALTR